MNGSTLRPLAELGIGRNAGIRRRSGIRSYYRCRRWTAIIMVGVPLAAAGCGTSLDELLLQTTSAVGRTRLDQLLTDLANHLAERSERDGDAVDDGTDDGSGGDRFNGLSGDPDSGAMLFAANGCATCHCADAGGGCGLSAPALVGVSASTLDNRLRGDTPHLVKLDLTDQEIVDLEAYLQSLD